MAIEKEDLAKAALGMPTDITVDDVKETVDDTKNDIKGAWDTAKRVEGYAKRDLGKLGDKASEGFNYITASDEEKAQMKAEKEKEQAEKDEAEDRESKAKEDEAEAEAERLERLQESYILHTAMIECSKAFRPSYLVVPISHGEFIQGIPQLNIKDSKPLINIRSFGVCKSPLNPEVQKAASEILEKVNNEEKTFSQKVMSIFCKEPDNKPSEIDESLLSQCVGKCIPVINMDWVDGKEDVLVEGEAALLGKCSLKCLYGGDITLYTSGQQE